MAFDKSAIVEVVYATPQQQVILKVAYQAGDTLQSVINRSGILTLFPEIDLTKQRVGIFAERKELHDPVSIGDRIEIYRPLQVDPKEARRLRAQKKAKR